MPFVKEGHSI